jgi:ATP-dependent exoDNAse (exonuclease V) beta subunit
MQVPVGLDAVQAMTVHKAKGLGFPVVIAMLYASGRSGVSSGFIAEPDGRARLVRVNADLAEYDIALAAAKEQEDTRQAVDRMNALYVALTRAHQEMYVIGVKKEKDTFPFDLLPAEGFSPRAEKEPPVRSGREGDPKAKLSHDTQSLSMELAEGLLSAAERRRGELVHRVLELAGGASLETLEEALAAAADRAAREAREPPEEARLLLPALAALVRGTAVAATFEPGPAGRRVLLEQEFCDRAGRLFRMDRVVVDPDRVTVVDWKTGAEEPAQHEAQIRGYMDILAEAWPGRAVTGILAYVDHGSAREVGT